MARARRALAAIGTLALVAGLAVVVTPEQAGAVDNGLALTPPMGWNGFNHFTRNVTASIVEAEARTIVSSGMKADGYDYVNLDGGWDLLQRSADGQLQPDPAKFPDGIKPVADYVHSLGLKFGIYTAVGTTNCAGTSAASFGHYQQDVDTFASWGVDYVKVDWCAVPSFPGMTAEQVAQMLYGQFGDALRASPRPMLYSLSTNAGAALQPWTWAPSVGNLWRTTGDVADNYNSMVTNFQLTAPLDQFAGPGAWNDPDMLEVGNGGMTAAEDQSQFSLWAEMAAPLIAGNDLSTMSAATQDILTNRDVIAVDQDPLGKQGHVLTSAGGHWVLNKPLANGDHAVLLFNQTGTPAMISTTATQIGLGKATDYTLRDLWQHTTTETTGTIAGEVPAHAVVMYRVAPNQGDAGTIAPQTEFGLSAPSDELTAGQPTTVTASFTNDGRSAVSDLALSLQAPAGWTVAPSAQTTFGAVPGGHSVTATWNVTASAPTAPISTASLSAMAAYIWGDDATPASTSADISLNMVAPVQPPFQTFASTQASFGQAGSTFGIDADGADDWVGVDQIGTVYLPAGAGPSTVAQVEITSQQNTNANAKAGLVMRNDITASGKSPGYVILFVTPGQGFELEWDSNSDGFINVGTPVGGTKTVTTYPSWVRLVKDGSTFTGYWSTDGQTWNLVGSANVPDTAATQDVGIFSTSHSAGVLGLSTFDNFSVQSN
ncbi:MAG: alpha-galactosidase [Mycobacterium sp.]|nr:alpha-galactosidase [Mycobacterium sp.]